MENQNYNYAIVRSFVTWSMIWGLVAVLVGVIVSLQMVDPDLNFPPYLTFGRLRPIHTNAGLYGWGVGVICATCFYIVQRLCKVPLRSDKAGKIPTLVLQRNDHRLGGHPAARLHLFEGIP